MNVDYTYPLPSGPAYPVPTGPWRTPNDVPDRGTWQYRGLSFGNSKPFRFCPHCGEVLEQAGAPFWNAEPLYETNEARVQEAESEGDE